MHQLTAYSHQQFVQYSSFSFTEYLKHLNSRESILFLSRLLTSFVRALTHVYIVRLLTSSVNKRTWWWWSVAVLRWGQGAQAPNLAQAPKFLIGSIVISLSRCCLPNDEGPGPKNIFFLEPPLMMMTMMTVTSIHLMAQKEVNPELGDGTKVTLLDTTVCPMKCYKKFTFLKI